MHLKSMCFSAMAYLLEDCLLWSQEKENRKNKKQKVTVKLVVSGEGVTELTSELKENMSRAL